MIGPPRVLSITVARRFILGKQGLWPGRRWTGQVGTEHAMRAIEHLQLDPLVVIARSHDLMLHSRVIDYQPDLWAELAYHHRQFFDWGGWLASESAGSTAMPVGCRLTDRSCKHPVGWIRRSDAFRPRR